MIIYEKNTGGLIKTGDRSISKFPSGLIRVDQTYVGKTGEESTHREILGYENPMPNQENTPEIDGLYIFPEVQESRDGTGFTKYQCSAFGRTTDEYREISRTQSTLIYTYNKGLVPYLLQVVVNNMTGTIVRKKGEFITPEDIALPEEFRGLQYVRWVKAPQYNVVSITESNFVNQSAGLESLRKYDVKFDAPIVAEGQADYRSAVIALQDPFVKITAQRNFGRFVEYEFEASRSGSPAEF